MSRPDSSASVTPTTSSQPQLLRETAGEITAAFIPPATEADDTDWNDTVEPDIDELRDEELEDTALETDEEPEDRTEAEEESGADDTIGVYLRQMGAIPLLTREQELELAQRLEYHRNRFRAAALICPLILLRARDMFERIASGRLPLDPHIDVYSSEELRLSRSQILSRLKPNLNTLT
ncbi:MAG: hypothetical protein NZ703_13370, partial [Gemmataceae bacterium]|nr:hypothetical protein [Gemmataceae bacterium]